MNYAEEEAEIDDILAPKRKKGVKSGPKGKRREREICKLLTARFQPLLSKHPNWGLFSRSVGSGNRWGQNVQLSAATMTTFSGDIAPPENFRFVIESKGGYNDVDLCCAFDGGVTTLDEFIQQVSDDAQRSNRKPMIIWRKDRKPHLCLIKSGEMPAEREAALPYTMKYREWTIYFLQDVLALPDEFFFSVV